MEANLGPQKSKNQKFSKSKSVLPKMSARFFYPGKRRPRPIWGPPGQFFSWAGKIQKLPKFCLFSLVGPWALFTRFGALAAIHPRWGNRFVIWVGVARACHANKCAYLGLAQATVLLPICFGFGMPPSFLIIIERGFTESVRLLLMCMFVAIEPSE